MFLREFSTVGIGPAPLPGATFIMMGDPDLGSAIANSYNVGLTHGLPAISSSLTVDGFYSSLSKNITVANFQPEFMAMPFLSSRVSRSRAARSL